jgi:hypothetical protein
MAKSTFMKVGMHIIALEPISTAYFIKQFQETVRVYIRQRVGKNITAATTTQETIEELFY